MPRDSDVATLPLHQQAVIWATKANIALVLPADNCFALRYVTLEVDVGTALLRASTRALARAAQHEDVGW
jgi:hypothetical protein